MILPLPEPRSIFQRLRNGLPPALRDEPAVASPHPRADRVAPRHRAVRAPGLRFASVTVRLGPVAIVGRAHGALFGPDAVIDPGRFGGGIDLRGTFSR